MAKTRRITSRIFWSTLRYAHRGLPWVERGTTQEIEYPYRSARSLVLRVPFTLPALVVGRWGAPRDEEEALLDAIGGRFQDLEELGLVRSPQESAE